MMEICSWQIPANPAAKNLFIQYEDGSAFHVLAKSKAAGWRVAALRLRTRFVEELQIHRTTMETFEPLQGSSILLVNTEASVEGIRAFMLDRPILLYTNIWHNVLTLSEESVIKITENAEVDAEEVKLPARLSVSLVD
jgi:ureidoglycolate hydrolase